MNSHPAVTVHGIRQARAALAPGRPVTLISAPGAALAGGCQWWRAMIEAARAEFATTPCDDILDCGDAPGRAMAALRSGQRILILEQTVPAFPAVRAAAATLGALVLARRPESLDLGSLDLRTVWGVARLAGWLAAVDDSAQGLR